MIRRKLSDVKTDLARISGAVGMQATDPRVIDLLNIATEELINESDIPSIIDRYNFKVYGGTITIPAPYERILYLKVNDTPIPMQSPWFEFVGYGPSLINEADTSDGDQLGGLRGLEGVLDRDNVLLFRDIPDPSLGVNYTIRLETQVDETDGAEMPDPVIIMGSDENGVQIRSGSGGVYHDGITFNWSAGSGSTQYAEDAQVYSTITDAIKPVTRMPINVYAVPVGGGDNILIGQWGPNDTSPSYRRYRIPGLSPLKEYTVTSRVRQRFVPVINDNDFLQISNLPALRSMIMAVYYFETGKDDLYAAKKMIAIDLLKKEAKAYRGDQRKKPLITFNEGMCVRRDGRYII